MGGCSFYFARPKSTTARYKSTMTAAVNSQGTKTGGEGVGSWGGGVCVVSTLLGPSPPQPGISQQ